MTRPHAIDATTLVWYPESSVTAEPRRLIQPVPAPSVMLSLGENEAAVLDTFVVPGYLQHFWELARKLLLVGPASRVLHLGCLTGYPDSELLQLMPSTTGVGVDPSLPCLAVAGSKVDAFGFAYLHAHADATGLPEGTFSHALLLHPSGQAQQRQGLFREMHRLLYAGGQALVSVPLSHSFPELVDLLAEYALKFDDLVLTQLLEALLVQRVTALSVATELESAGFGDVNVELSEVTLTFDSGRSLLEDPAARFFIIPQLADWLERPDLSEAMAYVAKAVDKYWSDERLEVTLKLAAFSARR